MFQNLNPEVVKGFIKDRITEESVHVSTKQRYKRYYEGEHDILFREAKTETAPNHKIILNFAELIIKTNWQYLFGQPISVDTFSDDPLVEKFKEELEEVLKDNNSSVTDAELGLEASVYGDSVEVHYIEDGQIKFKKSDALSWVFYDFNDEQHALHHFETYEYVVNGDGIEKIKILNYEIYTPTSILKYEERDGEFKFLEEIPHFYGMLPVIKVNNAANLDGDGSSDLKSVIGLNDAINLTVSDRQNALESAVFPTMILKNLNIDLSQLEQMKANRLLSFTSDPQVQSDIMNLKPEVDGEMLKEQLSFLIESILLLSFTPDLFTREGSKLAAESAESIRLKMHTTESKSSSKIINFTKGYRQRIMLIAKQLEMQGKGNFFTQDCYDHVALTFNKTIPSNIAQTIDALVKGVGLFSKRTLIQQAPFIESVEDEIERIQEEEGQVPAISFNDDSVGA